MLTKPVFHSHQHRAALYIAGMQPPTEMYTIIASLMVALFGSWAIVRVLLGPPDRTHYKKANVAQRELEATERAIRSAAAAIAPPSRRSRDLISIVRHQPDFTERVFMMHAVALFHQVQAARDTADPSLVALLTAGALETGLASAPGLQSIDGCEVQRARVTRAVGIADSGTVEVRFQAIIDETRNGTPTPMQVSELWHFSRSKEHPTWRVVHIYRDWRRLLSAPPPPIIGVEHNQQGHREVDLLDRLKDREDINSEAAITRARTMFDRWLTALDQGQPALLIGDATESCINELRATLDHYWRFDQTLRVDESQIGSGEINRFNEDSDSRFLSIRFLTTARQYLDATGPKDAVEKQPWSRYITLVSVDGGPWLLDEVDDDTSWVV